MLTDWEAIFQDSVCESSAAWAEDCSASHEGSTATGRTGVPSRMPNQLGRRSWPGAVGRCGN